MSFLFLNGEPWVKKGMNGNFDVPMGSYDGAEVCELVGLYLLNKITSKNAPFNKSEIGLYRDDGLAVRQGSGRSLEKDRQVLTNLFREEGLDITVETNIKRTDYLDVVFDLESSTHRPFRKPNDFPMYINIKSNHPPTIIKQLPKNIEKRLSCLSSNKEIFDQEVNIYQRALKQSGYKTKLEYQEPSNERKKRIRRRNITWYNPPFNQAVKTRIGQKFLKLIDKHFPRGSELHKYFNRSTIKVSFCTTQNMKAHIDKHNRTLLNPIVTLNDEKTCKCQVKNECPLQGNCLQKSVVYQADITERNRTKTYYGLTENEFKNRFYAHKSSLKHEDKRGNTELSKHAWNISDRVQGPAPDGVSYPTALKCLEEGVFDLSWSIKSTGVLFKPGAKHCDLCLTEKTTIAMADPKTTLNSRSELLYMCKHKPKYLLANIKCKK